MTRTAGLDPSPSGSSSRDEGGRSEPPTPVAFPPTEGAKRRKPQRTIRLVRSPSLDGVGVFCVTVDDHSSFYVLHEIPCEIGGRGFAVHRLGMGTLYHVRIGPPRDCSCECKGFLYHGYCRHVLGLLALEQVGRL